MPGYVTPEFLAAVSAHTGVPVQFLSGSTIDAVWESAKRAVEWKEATAPAVPPPLTSAVSPSYGPVPMRPVPDDVLRAWREGQLAERGAPAPPPRRNGERHA